MEKKRQVGLRQCQVALLYKFILDKDSVPGSVTSGSVPSRDIFT